MVLLDFRPSVCWASAVLLKSSSHSLCIIHRHCCWDQSVSGFLPASPLSRFERLFCGTLVTCLKLRFGRTSLESSVCWRSGCCTCLYPHCWHSVTDDSQHIIEQTNRKKNTRAFELHRLSKLWCAALESPQKEGSHPFLGRTYNTLRDFPGDHYSVLLLGGSFKRRWKNSF